MYRNFRIVINIRVFVTTYFIDSQRWHFNMPRIQLDIGIRNDQVFPDNKRTNWTAHVYCILCNCHFWRYALCSFCNARNEGQEFCSDSTQVGEIERFVSIVLEIEEKIQIWKIL